MGNICILENWCLFTMRIYGKIFFMMTGKEKSEKRRQRAAEAIAALGIPGVATTRNLEAWLIERQKNGERVGMSIIATTATSGYWSPTHIRPADTIGDVMDSAGR